MGPSIARTNIEAHHGLIWAKNRDHGGASFRITLPLPIVSDPSHAVPLGRDMCGSVPVCHRSVTIQKWTVALKARSLGGASCKFAPQM